MSVPNQCVYTIIKPTPSTPFLQINELDWQEAFINLKPATFAVYLYLAQNDPAPRPHETYQKLHQARFFQIQLLQ